MADLDGRVIAIAGAAGGLGPVVCERLVAGGARIACSDLSQDRLEELGSRLEVAEDRFDAAVVDLLDAGAARDWASHIGERFGRIDCLLHLVGGWRGGEALASFDLADYEWLHDVLVRTVIHSTRAFHDHLAASEHGRFVVVSSSQAQRPDGTNAAYAAAKAAAESWTLALADSFTTKEAAATANVVVVNAIVTPEMRAANPDKPYKTFTRAEDIAEASDAAAKMNGKRLELHP
jgi:NAD(P)-dependent dehydrogenase (short-subunit alcohol dehydrogenase family)